MRKVISSWRWNIFAFFLPAMLLILIGMLQGQFPFGEKTLLAWDMNWQYVSFFSYLHEILHGNASALYSLSRAVGGDMVGVAAYYLMSPFNLIFFFVDAEHIYLGIAIMLMLKVGSCGASMFFCLSGKQKEPAALLFSSAYALSAYTIAYWFNIMWLDAVILLPLLAFSIRRLAEERHWLMYTFILALGIITNFYMGYMLCLFSLVYFLCYFLLISDCGKNFRTLLIYAGSSLLGGLLSMWILIPALLSMQGGKGFSGIALLLRDFTKRFGYRELIPLIFTGTISGEQITSGMPLLYCGVGALIFAGYWFLNRKIKLRKKAAYLLLLLLLVLSFSYTNLYCIWHGFNLPMGSPYRFSFLYVFLISELAWLGYREWIRENRQGTILLLLCGAFLLLLLFVERERFTSLDRTGVWVVNALLTVVYPVAAALLRYRSRLLVPAFLGIVCFELLFNAEALYRNTNQYSSPTVAEYDGYMERVAPLVQQVKEKEGVFRTVLTKEARRSDNDSLLFGVNGLSSYTSMEKADTLQIGANLGYECSLMFGMRYGDGSPKSADALLGVRYMITSGQPGEGWRKLSENDGLGLFENKYALPFAFFAGEEIQVLDVAYADSFDYLNRYYQALTTETSGDLFTEAEVAFVEAPGCVKNPDGTWKATHSEEGGYVEWQVSAREGQELYISYAYAGISEVTALIGDREIALHEMTGTVKDLGQAKVGQTVRLRFFLSGNEVFSPEQVYIYGEDTELLSAYVSEINQENVSVSMESDSRFSVNCTNEDSEYLICTLPYDSGWRVKVDGVWSDAKDVSHFLAVPLTKGAHEIDFYYWPRGLSFGIAVSVAAAGVLVFCVLWEKRKLQQGQGGAEK